MKASCAKLTAFSQAAALHMSYLKMISRKLSVTERTFEGFQLEMNSVHVSVELTAPVECFDALRTLHESSSS